MPIKSVLPRISLITALDNFGKVYVCLTQVNTDSKVMGLYINELVKLLDREDSHWRDKTILLHDGAKYAQSKSTENALNDLKVPFMLSAPHSYNIAPIEIVFSALKSGNLNPEALATGRTGFSNICKLVV